MATYGQQLRTPWMFVPIFLSVALVVAAFAFIFFSVKPSGENMNIHYTIYFGIDFNGPWWWYYVFVGIGMGLIVLYTVIGTLAGKTHEYLSRVVFAALVVQEVLLAVGIFWSIALTTSYL